MTLIYTTLRALRRSSILHVNRCNRYINCIFLSTIFTPLHVVVVYFVGIWSQPNLVLKLILLCAFISSHRKLRDSVSTTIRLDKAFLGIVTWSKNNYSLLKQTAVVNFFDQRQIVQRYFPSLKCSLVVRISKSNSKFCLITL